MSILIDDIAVGLIFDGDILCYRACFAAEKRVYFLKSRPLTGPVTGPAGGAIKSAAVIPSWSTAKAAMEYCVANALNYKTEITWVRMAEPVEHVVANLHGIIKRTIKQFVENGYVVGNYYVFLTGNGTKPNFRETISPEYKLNRAGHEKPTHLAAIRDYISKNFPCVFTEGCEADDYLGQASIDMVNITNYQPVIVTLDKDLMQIPGNHFDFVKGILEHVTQEEGDRVFLKQMLTGDRADNIKGLAGIGEVKATAVVDPRKDFDKCLVECHKLYAKEYGAFDWKTSWNTNCDLLWIWRTVPDVCPYKVPILVP